jgi:ADP-ribosylation factor 2-binding protein
MQDIFMNKNYKHFEDSEDNKLIYTSIHKEYINLIEKYLENELQKRIEHFSMQDFMRELMEKRNEFDGMEIFEILVTFDDFIEFKDLMLSFKAVS